MLRSWTKGWSHQPCQEKGLSQKRQSATSSAPAKPHSTHNARPQFRRNTPSLAVLSEAKSKLSRYCITSGYCHLFFASLPCTCPYQHTCPFCSAKHPVSQCYRPNYHHNGGRPFDHGSSRPQASRGRGGPNNYRNWLPPNLEVAGPAVLNVPKISEPLEESAPELCHYVVHGLTNGFSLGYNGHNENIHLNNLQSASSKPVFTKKFAWQRNLWRADCWPISGTSIQYHACDSYWLGTKKRNQMSSDW